jgi:hypothetical protein
MTEPAIVVSTTTLTNPHGAGSDYALYSLALFDGSLYAGGWLNGTIATPGNPDGWGLDRIYVSSSPTLDDFSQMQWTNGQSPGTLNQTSTTLFDEMQNAGTDTYSMVPYYGPGQAFSGNLYYQVNDPTVVAEGSNLVMYMTAAPNQNEYPVTSPTQPNGNPNYQLGWNSIGWALSSDSGATWTWEGTLPLTNPDGTALLAPVTLAFPTDPSVTYNVNAAGNETPAAVFNPVSGLDLWYVSLGATPDVWRSHEDRSGAWAVAQPCQFITGAGTVDLHFVNPDVASADDGSGTLWFIGQAWGGPHGGSLELFYSSAADGADQGLDWHAWDGADGVLVAATSTVAAGLYDFLTPTILSVGNGSISIDYAVPVTIRPDGFPTPWQQINEVLTLPLNGTFTPNGQPNAGFAAVDQTTGGHVAATPTVYSGPVSGLQNQFAEITPDNLNISVSSDSWFILTGGGNDAIAVKGGNNVLDGGGGSNFLVGGNGSDTFYVDDRAVAGNVWSTAANFHSGDYATIWGVTPQDFNIGWGDNQGAVGYTGLTLHATAAGHPNAYLTLAGYSTADLSNGRLSIAYGTDTSGNHYMLIHGD